jgi:autotransporter translocation and assembly factor TamB
MAKARKVAAWLLFLTVAGAGLTLAVFLCTPAPLRIANRLLERSLKEEGITLAFKTSEGSLAEGMDFEGVSLRSADGWSVEARHVFFRLSVTSFLVHRPVVKDLLVESPRIVLPEGWNEKGKGGQSGAAPKSRLPRLSLRRVRLVDAKISAPGLVPGDARFSELRFESFEGAAFLRRASLSVRGKLLGAEAERGVAPPLRLDGQVTWQRGRGVALDLLATMGGSQVAVRGAPPRRRGGGELFAGRVRLSPLDLSLLRPVWHEAPEWVVSGKADVKLFRGRVEWAGRVEARGVGAARTKGWVAKHPGGLGIGGELESAGLALAGSHLLHPVDSLAPAFAGKVSWTLDVDRDRQLRGTVEGRLGFSKVARFDIQRADFKVRITPEEITVAARGDGPLVRGFDGQVAVRPGEGIWRAQASAGSADLRGILQTLDLWKDPPKPFGIKDPWLQEVSVELAGSQGDITVGGTATDYQGARIEFQLAKKEQAPRLHWRFRCEGLAPEACGLDMDGSVWGEAEFAGSDLDRGTVEVRALSSRIAGLRLEPFFARLDLDGARIGLSPVSLDTDLGKVKASGEWTGRELRLEGRATAADAGPLARRAGVAGVGGALDGTFSLAVRGEAWALKLAFVSDGFRYGTVGASKLEGDLQWSSDRRDGKIVAAAKGLSVNEVFLGDARVTLASAGGIVRGEASGALGEGRFLSAKVEGPASLAEGALRLSETRVQLFEGREFVQEGTAALTWNASQVGLEGLKLTRGAKSSSLSVSLGRTVSQDGGLPISARFEAHGLPLNALPIPPSAGTVGGRVEADLTVGGTTAAPTFQGTAHVEEGVFRFANSDLEYRPITLELTAAGDKLKIAKAHITSPEGGEGAAVGWIRFRGLLPVEFLLEGSGGDIPFVVGREMVGRAQFYAKIHGTPAAPVIEGIAKVTKGRIELPELSHQAPLPSTVRFKNAPEGSPLAFKAKSDEPEPERHLTGRIQLDFDDVWVQSRLLLAQVEGRIVARLTEQGPVLEGSASVIEGRYLFMGKKFDLRESKILFKGNPDNVPELDVTARYDAPDYEVTARLTGPPQRPVVNLTSRPSLEQSDVLAVIMFGKPLKDLESGQKQNWSAAAVAMAAQYQASPLLESGNTGLANLQVGVDDATGGGTVGFSRYIGDRLVLEYKQVFGTLPEERLNLRYRINRRWSVEVETSSVGSSGGDLVWEQRY